MSTAPANWTVDYYLANESDCIKILEDSDALQEIPSLNTESLDHFQDGQLVHFQGMIQDMYNPEYYFKNYQVIDLKTGENSTRSGMYLDGARCQSHEQILVDSDKNENSERLIWIVMSTPGLNDWAKESYKVRLNKNINPAEMPTIDKNKRSMAEIDESMDCAESVRKKEKVSANNSEADSSQFQKESEYPSLVSKDYLLNFPIPNEDGKTCIVKVYHEFSFKLNQTIDIIGFLSLDPNLSKVNVSEDMVNNLERQIHYPSASIIPRLHAIKIEPSINKLIPESANILLKAESVRSDLRTILTQLLFGDEMAADYLICHLISSVYIRRDCLCLGAFSLNITNFPKMYKNFPKDFYDILKQIVAKSHFLDLTLENLNNMNFIPKKDYDCNRLTSGTLQLSYNTHLIIDETGLTTGQVTEFGKKNYNALSNLIDFQSLKYDFQFCPIEYETDIPVLIFSEVKSFIPCQTQIVLQPDSEIVKIYPQVMEAAKQYLKDENRSNNIRQYVNTLKHVKFEFSDEAVKIVQEDFSRLRQLNRNLTPDNLHLLMVLSRLMSLSYGYKTLKSEIWKKSLEMELQRMSRLG